MELLHYLKDWNWIDIFIVILFVRICYISVKNGIFIELTKLLGTTLSIYLACHYYILAGNYLHAHIPLSVKLEFLDFLGFFILVLIGYLVFLAFRATLGQLIRLEAVPLLNRWGAFIFGIFRAVLFCSLIMFMLFISSISYLRNSVTDSSFGIKILSVTPKVYTAVWDGFMSRFMFKERLNPIISQIQARLPRR